MTCSGGSDVGGLPPAPPQGLPDAQAHLALSEHARKLGIKGRAFQRAKEQLVMHGFVHERRVSGERGRWVTQQLFSNVPLAEAEVLGLWHSVGIGDPSSPSVRFPTVGQPKARTVGHQLPVDEEQEKNSSRPPTEAPRTAMAYGPLTAEEDQAERVLLSLRHASEDLHLGVAEARPLVAQAAEWFRRGISGGELRRVLSSRLPRGGVRCAAGFLGHRLLEKMPEAALPARDVEPEPSTSDPLPPDPTPPSAVPRYVPPLITCAGPGSEHVFRAMAGETECPDCRQAAAWARWAERRAADLGVDLAEEAAVAVEAGRNPDGWRSRLAAASGATRDQ
ncbi:hypothetical protein ACFWM7_15135 [Streptomyces sp. NPDC058375]|uniref:hypothetical protein n=1 Tax=Streptomyces sp. NPDC058375 TaxID=3346467 RepID=UPI003652AEC4